MTVLAVIPARYASTRFPGKPLAPICGKPMIQWVYERVSRVTEFEEVIVATDHPDIRDAVKAFGGEARLTHPEHASGTDRVWEIAKDYPQMDYVFNIQGDEPLINPMYLEEAVAFLKFHHEVADIVTVKAPIRSLHELEDPNVVKVVASQFNQALYFSRSAIPFVRDAESGTARIESSFRHVGIYGFKRSTLQQFVSLPVSPLEELEKLEQLRALEAGMRIYAVTVPEAPIGVDTPQDLAMVEALIERQKA